MYLGGEACRDVVMPNADAVLGTNEEFSRKDWLARLIGAPHILQFYELMFCILSLLIFGPGCRVGPRARERPRAANDTTRVLEYVLYM